MRRRRQKPPQPYIPVHFEDEDDDDLGYFRNRTATQEAPKPPAPATAQQRKTQKIVAAPFTQKPEFSGGSQPPVVMTRPVTPVAQPRKDFSFNLNHLSPLKQAVIMSEVLGQPVGMRQTGEERQVRLSLKKPYFNKI
jgi:hypothetical protein